MTHTSAHHKGAARHSKLRSLLKKLDIRKIVIIVITIGLLFMGAGLIWVATLKLPDLSSFQERRVAQSTKIYDRTGEVLLYDIHEDAKRTLVSFNEISVYIKNATIAIEDAEFYSHGGIKPKAILRAVLADLTPGGLTQGGSTITQQVIKNSVLTRDKTLTRKVKEWVLALKLEKILTKDQIFSTYLNENPYGGNTYGVEEASKLFFGKSAKDVTLAQAAYIAALPQAPSYYSPYGSHVADLNARQKLVLRKMKEYNFITDEEYTTAINEKVEFLAKNNTGIRAPHFSLMVKDYLVNKYGEDMVELEGLKVTTTLDMSMQEKAEKVVTSFGKTMEQSFNASNTAMVAIDPRNGDILVLVGSRDYFNKSIDGNYNIATAKRQPGSSFKPFVYATAFMKGYTPDTILFDVKTEFAADCNPDGTPKRSTSKCYSPNNYDDVFEGPLTIREALAQSRNVPAVKALYLAGIKDSIQTAESMGLTSLTDPDRYGLTLVLGGGEVSLLEMTSAYGVFANDGVRNPHRMILKVEDAEGNILESATDNPTQAIPTNVARQISNILSDKKIGFANINDLLSPVRREIAVKTGTTNDYRDVWTLGYTPNLVVGAWAGKNDNTPMQKKLSGLIITPLWAAFWNEIKDKLPEESFRSPDPIDQTLKPVFRGIWKGGESYTRDSVSKKVATDATPEEAREEVIVNNVHSILHWVDKQDPLGPIPKNPENDSQYANWEYGVRKWVDTWKLSHPEFIESSNFSIPEEEDDVHTDSSRPEIKITSPSTRSTYSIDDSITIKFDYKGEHNLKKADFFANGAYLGTKTNGDTAFTFNIDDVAHNNDSMTIKVSAQDDVFHTVESSIQIKLKH